MESVDQLIPSLKIKQSDLDSKYQNLATLDKSEINDMLEQIQDDYDTLYGIRIDQQKCEKTNFQHHHDCRDAIMMYQEIKNKCNKAEDILILDKAVEEANDKERMLVENIISTAAAITTLKTRIRRLEQIKQALLKELSSREQVNISQT